jgi:hypothetical protein
MSQKLWVFIAGAALLLLQSTSIAAVKYAPHEFSKETKICVKCHKKRSPGIVKQWEKSRHFSENVGCYECHKADGGDKDAFFHQQKKVGNKAISIIVSPKDCANCHENEVEQFTNSHHAQAARILGSMDNLLAEVVEGNLGMVTPAFEDGVSAAVVNGCWQCHGTEVKVLEDGKLDPATWPNTGIGRVNPDGSRGSCTACHSRHSFSVAVARNPENCGKCHMGPDHPQYEIYIESKHGIAFRANEHKMNLDAQPTWIVGKDYSAAPTCATCHMSATKTQDVSHDVGLRISWTNRPWLSIRPELTDAKMGLPGADIKWDERRDNMKNVCEACHSDEFVDNFYVQYDELVNLYNTKFALPGKRLIDAAKPMLKPGKFSNKLDFIWFEIWHHEGRRARHGAAMMGPDYTHWHGTYEVGKHFYAKYIPELQKLVKANLKSEDAKKVAAAENLQKVLDEVLNSDDHKWYIGKMDAEEQEARRIEIEEFNKRYNK